MLQWLLFGGDVVRSGILEVILIPVLLAWAAALLVHRSQPRLYNAVVSRIACKARISMEAIAELTSACTIGYRKAYTCSRILNTQNKNVIRLLELSSCDHITYNATC